MVSIMLLTACSLGLKPKKSVKFMAHGDLVGGSGPRCYVLLLGSRNSHAKCRKGLGFDL